MIVVVLLLVVVVALLLVVIVVVVVVSLVVVVVVGVTAVVFPFRFTPLRRTAWVWLGGFSRWSEKVGLDPFGVATVLTSSKSHQSRPSSSWPTNRYAATLGGPSFGARVTVLVSTRLTFLLSVLSDEAFDWDQSGDAGHGRASGGWFNGWSHRPEQHLPHGGEKPLRKLPMLH